MSVMYYPGYSQVVVTSNFRTHTIGSVTNANPMVVTTVDNHGYVPGLNVAFLIPTQFGMQELNSLNGDILSVTSNTLTIAINSTNFSLFSYPVSLPYAYTPPSVIPNASGALVPPQPLPYGNEKPFEGASWNAGQPGNLI